MSEPDFKVQVNFQEEKKPSFRSDRTQFMVSLPNLNYDVTAQVTTQDTTQVTTQDTTQVTLQIQRLLDAIGEDTASTQELMERCAIKNRSYFGKEYLRPALKAGLIEMTIPGKHNSRQQKYRKKQSE